MDEQEYQWRIELIQSRYDYLNLTFAQAEQLYRNERETSAGLGSDHLLSHWEELDFELATMQQMLSAEQLRLYLPVHAEAVAYYTDELRGHDASLGPQLAYAQALLDYYRDTVVPALQTSLPGLRGLPLQVGEPLFQFIGQECDRRLQRQWQRQLAQHHRFYRSFGPRGLELQRLIHKQLCLWPAYEAIEPLLNKPVRTLVRRALKRMGYLLAMVGDQWEEFEHKWAAHSQQLWEQYHGPRPTQPGWGYVQQKRYSEKQRRRQQLFNLLWLSRNLPERSPSDTDYPADESA